MHATAPPNREVSGSAAGTDHRTGHRTPRTSHPTSHRPPHRPQCRSHAIAVIRVSHTWLRSMPSVVPAEPVPKLAPKSRGGMVARMAVHDEVLLVDAAHRELEIAAVAVGRSSTCAARAGATHAIIRTPCSHVRQRFAYETHQQHTRHICERIVYIVRIATIRNPIPLTLDHGFQAAYTTTR